MLTLAEVFESTVRHHGPRPAIVHGDTNLTWGQFGERVAVAAGLLTGLGLAKGRRFGIQAPNSPRFDELKWAGFRCGAIPVPINWRLVAPEIAHILADAECEAIFVAAEFLPVYEAPELAPWRDKLICLSGDAPDGMADLPRYDDLFAKAAPVGIEPGNAGDDAILQYTGGTTGRSKGVRISHTNVITSQLGFAAGLRARPDDVYLHVAPMFHSADLLAVAWVLAGAGHAYLPAFSPAAFLDCIARDRVTATIAVPAMLMMTLADPAFGDADLSSLRLLGWGASPMDPEWIKRVAAAFPDIEISNCYGLTETAPDLTIFDPDELRQAIADDDPSLASVGKPNPVVALRVVGPDGKDVASGASGELWARGPNITKGYLNLPEQTAAALTDGWLHTGDVARIDERGYVYLLDRVKDMIVSGGENVYCAEVESALYTHPGVHECAVIGLPHEKFGESVAAIVVAAAGASVDAETLIAHCRPLIAGYKLPRRVVFVEALPKSAMGKILKTDLRESMKG
ncbi:MAG TPA: AMP-binding protein [Alphaproteobacteria bacterium]|nr:AMP-binding protein [Alphaproteobacteria bacterium]